MPFFVESATWIAVGFAIGAAVLAVSLGIALIANLVRGRRPAGADVERILQESNARFEAMLEDLGRALERARAEGERSRQLSAISSTIDLDAVLARTLEAACALPGIDAGTIVVPQREQGPLIATLGMSSEEAARQPVAGPPDGRRARAVRIGYRYDEEELAEDGDLLRGGMAVPLRGEEAEVIGTLAVFWRGADREPAEEDLAELEHLAATAGPSIENARRFREARQLADLDALTNLHNRRYFHETLAREVARAHRYNRRLGLVLFDIDDFKAINDKVGHLAGDAVLAELAERVHSVVRTADIACRVGGDEFGVILPESTLADADQLYRRLQFAVSARPTASADRLRLSAGIAELKPEDDAVSFFERADEALYRAKESGKGQAVTANHSG